MPLNKDEIENIMCEVESHANQTCNCLDETFVIDIKTIRRILENPCNGARTVRIKDDK